jgi:hypothetical protein
MDKKRRGPTDHLVSIRDMLRAVQEYCGRWGQFLSEAQRTPVPEWKESRQCRKLLTRACNELLIFVKSEILDIDEKLLGDIRTAVRSLQKYMGDYPATLKGSTRGGSSGLQDHIQSVRGEFSRLFNSVTHLIELRDTPSKWNAWITISQSVCF